MSPTSIQRLDNHRIRITWSDNTVRDYTASELRDRCPCATCREKQSAPAPPPTELTVLSMAETQPTSVVGMKPAGAYAYNIQFSNGCNSGLYTFELLQELGQQVENE